MELFISKVNLQSQGKCTAHTLFISTRWSIWKNLLLSSVITLQNKHGEEHNRDKYSETGSQIGDAGGTWNSLPKLQCLRHQQDNDADLSFIKKIVRNRFNSSF